MTPVEVYTGKLAGQLPVILIRTFEFHTLKAQIINFIGHYNAH